jgi:hypothetical protein
VRAFEQAKPLYALLAAAYLVLLGFAVWKRTPWEAAALGATFIAIAPVELTCYYYAFVMAVAVLHESDERVGRIMLLMTAATVFIYFHWLNFMPTWLDEQYTLMSVVTVAAFVAILWNFGLGPVLAQRRAERLAAAKAAAPAAAAAPATESAKPAPKADAKVVEPASSEESGPRRQPPGKKRRRR